MQLRGSVEDPEKLWRVKLSRKKCAMNGRTELSLSRDMGIPSLLSLTRDDYAIYLEEIRGHTSFMLRSYSHSIIQFFTINSIIIRR